MFFAPNKGFGEVKKGPWRHISFDNLCVENKNLKKGLDASKKLYEKGRYEKSLEVLLELETHFEKCWQISYLLGIIYPEVDKEATGLATNFLFRAFEENKKIKDLKSIAKIAEYLYKEKNEYKKSLEYYELFFSYDITSIKASISNNAKFNKRQVKKIVELMENKTPMKGLKNLSNNINSTRDEYLPSFSADGLLVMFTVSDEGGDNIYMSRKIDGEWQAREKLPEPLNSDKNEGALSITQDGKEIYFSACDRENSIGPSCDIYYSKLSEGKWSEPVNIGAPVNTASWESQPSVTPSGKGLYFISNRQGGKGKQDLWYSRRKNGKWITPINLGDSINTKGVEQAPFIHSDGRTLYFTSTGYMGMGDFDIYVSRRNKKGIWSKPKNMGYPINTPGNDRGIVLSYDGEHAYISRKNTKSIFHDLDLHVFEPEKKIRPRYTPYVKGTILDFETKKPLASFVRVIDIKKKEVITEIHSDSINGTFLLSLPLGKTYSFHVEKEGYLFHSENFSFDKENERKLSIERKNFIFSIRLKKVKKEETIILNNILFETASADLKEESLSEIKTIKRFLEINPNILIELSGHTDSKGSLKYNSELSLKRANSVKTKLVKEGIDKSRIIAAGYGPTMPIADNKTEEGRAKNRRTELKVL